VGFRPLKVGVGRAGCGWAAAAAFNGWLVEAGIPTLKQEIRCQMIASITHLNFANEFVNVTYDASCSTKPK